MIKGITGSGHIVVNHTHSSGPYISPNSNNPLQGMLRMNGNTMEAFDGSNWITVSGAYPSIDIDDMSKSALKWAINKMEEERKWAELAKENKAVEIALNNLEQARHQLNITAKLAREYETTS